GVGVEVHLRVERQHLAVAGDDQRVDFGQARVGFPECLVQRLQHLTALVDGALGNTDLAGNVFGFGVGQTGERIDEHLVDFLGRLGGDFFDVHTAFAGGHQRHALGAAIDDHADVQFFLDVGAFLDQQTTDLLAFGAGLVRHQLHTEDIVRVFANLIERLRHFHAAALTAAASVNL